MISCSTLIDCEARVQNGSDNEERAAPFDTPAVLMRVRVLLALRQKGVQLLDRLPTASRIFVQRRHEPELGLLERSANRRRDAVKNLLHPRC